MSKSRNYCFTINNYSAEEAVYALEIECTYVVVGHEIGECGTPHLQGFVMFPNAKTMKAVSKLLPRAHLEVAKGTPIQAMVYCKKDKEFDEKGVPPTGAGSRKDLDVVKRVLASTGRMADVVLVANSYQSVRMAECILKYTEKSRCEKPHVTWLYGATGTGKSRLAYQELGDDCYTCLSTGKWFEGYDAHENVLIDDMRKDFLKFHELLRLLDRYAMRVECKGGSRQFVAKRIFITSAYSPTAMFDSREDINQLLRRIDVTTELFPDTPPHPNF